MTKRIIQLFFILFIGLQGLVSQNIYGKVNAPDVSAASFASLRLLLAQDSSFVAGASADEAGNFVFSQIAPNAYIVRASLIGYADVFSEPVYVKSQDVQLNPIVLGAANALQEVQVNGRKSLIEVRPDMLVLNVEGSALTAGNSAFELLQRSPGVVITPQDNIMLQGKGNVLVMLNGRPSKMSGSDLTAFLKGLPAESISRIEFISQPSSQYDAQGIAGIINIRLKKNQNLGWNGSLNLANTQALHHRTTGGAQFNYRPGKVNVFANLSGTDAAQTIQQDIERNLDSKRFSLSMPKIEDWRSIQYQGGADYYLNERHSVGFLAIGSDYDNQMRADMLTQIFSGKGGAPDSSILAAIKNPERTERINYNVNYRFADTLGTEWTFDADQIRFRMNGRNQIDNQFINAKQELMSKSALASDLETQVDLWSLKTDYSRSLGGSYKIAGGAKANWSQTLNNTEGVSDSGNGFSPDAGRTNRSTFQERILAAYFNSSKEGSTFSWNLGLRAEHTDLYGLSTDIFGLETPVREAKYLDFFPSAYIMYNIGEMTGNSISFSYNRRIDRPAYRDLNPFVWQLDAFSSERGNPNLRPAYVNSTELKYTYKYAASIGLGYAQTLDVVSTIARVSGEQAFTMPENLAHQDNISLNINAPTPINAWWDGYCWIGVWQNRFQVELPEGKFRRNAWGGGAYLGQQIQMPKKIQFDFSFWAQFPTANGLIANKGIWSIDLGLKKRFYHDHATVKLSIYDLFNSQKWTDKTDFGGLKGSMRNDWESQGIGLQFSWKLGNEKLLSRSRKSGAENENNRIKGGKER